MRTILIADADTQTVETVARAAAAAGLRLAVADDGVQALERFRAELPAIVLVDRMLPVLDGIQVCQKIRETLAGRTAALFLLGVRGAPSSRRGGPAISGQLDKPLALDALLSAIHPFLAGGDEPAGASPCSLPDELAFDLAGNSLARVLTDLAAERRSGELVWSDGRVTRSLGFDRGQLIGGSSNARRDQWPGWAVRDPGLDATTRARLHALAVPGPGVEGWGAYLAARDALAPDAFAASRERWLVSMAIDLARREDGRAAFVTGRPVEEIAEVDGRALALIALRLAGGDPFESLLPAPLTLLERSIERADELGLASIEQEVLTLADRRHTLGDILALGRLTEHDLRPCVYGLLALGLVRPAATDPGVPVSLVSRMPDAIGSTDVPRQGDIASFPLAHLLGATSAASVTGIVQLQRAEARIAIHLNAGRIVFARSSDAHHRLGQVLVRHGKISGDDHARALTLLALQQRRRLGAILMGMGALSLVELHEGLCAQARGVLREAFSWPDGSYAVLDGDLPSDDMVSLDVSTSNLILDCLRELPLDELARRHAPPEEAVLYPAWEARRIRALLRPSATEQALLEAARDGIAVREAFLLPDLDVETAARAVFALCAIGCLEAAPPGTRRPRPAAEPAPEVLAELCALRSANRALQERVDRLESDNRRLRTVAGAAETLVG